MNGTLDVNGTSSDENANDHSLAAANIAAIEVVLIVGFIIILIAVIISSISCVVMRKRRRRMFNQDKSGHKVVCMIHSDDLPSSLPSGHVSITQSDQAHHHSNKMNALIVDDFTNPQIHIRCENGRVIESFYAFDLEDSCNDDDDEYDDTVHHSRQASYDDVVYPSPPAYNSDYDHLVDMDTLQSKIDTLTKSYRYYEQYENVIVDSDHQCPEGTVTLQSNGYESLNTASDSDVSAAGNSLDEDSCYTTYTKPPSVTGTLVRELQHMPIMQTIKADEVQ